MKILYNINVSIRDTRISFCINTSPINLLRTSSSNEKKLTDDSMECNDDSLLVQLNAIVFTCFQCLF